MGGDLLLVVVIVVALGFDFTNGFHDTANAVATSISTRALSPRMAVAIASVANLAGAFATTAVAKTVGKGIIDTGLANTRTILAALIGAIAWNLFTWWFGLPSSSALALFTNGSIDHFYIPVWVKIAAGVAIAAGTYVGGWRIMRTLGQRLYKMEPAAGFSAQVSAGAVIDIATRLGYPLSTTHVISGAVLGAGSTKRLSAVRWGIAGNIVVAWLLTIPAAALVAAAFYWPIEGIF